MTRGENLEREAPGRSGRRARWCGVIALLIALVPAATARAASLAISVPAKVAPGGSFTITITGSFASSEVSAAGAYLIPVIQYSSDRCASSATIETQEGLQLSYYLAPAGAQNTGISETQSPFTRSDTLTATRSGPRHVCAYLYPLAAGPGPGDSLAPIATADAPFLVLPGGGHGQIGIDGRVGSLRLDSSSLADVVSFAGPPDAQGTSPGEVPYFSGSHELGYRCQQRLLGELMTVSAHANCQTVFFINQRTRKLAAFFTSSAAYSGPSGIRPGMPATKAEQRTHVQAITGCLSGMFFGNPFGIPSGPRLTRAWMFVDVLGGRIDNRHPRRGPVELIGGRLGSLSLESTRDPVGLLFC